ncbi:MAG: aldo/keto reductase [Steroidobacteraceae bacterium]
MRLRLLGNTGIKVSEICLGAMTFGEESGFGAAKDECRRVYDAYRAAGGNFVDTANIYSKGTSERFVGEFIAAERGQIVLATKYSMIADPTNPNAGGNSRKNLQQSLEASLRRLGTDYVDLYWVHSWDGLTGIDEVLRALDDAVRSGKVLHVGFSNVPAWVVSRLQTTAELRGWSRIAALQLHYSLVERNIERELVPCARALGMAITAWSPLAGGLLTGKYADDATARASQPGRLTTTNWGRMFVNERNLAIVTALRQVAARLGRTPAQVAIRWLMQQPGNVIPIIGVRSLAQLDDLLGAAGFALDAEALVALDEVGRPPPAYPGSLIGGPAGRAMLHGEFATQIDMP